MTFRAFIMAIFQIRPVVLTRPRLSDEAIATALAVSEANPQWRAFMQLLDDFEEAKRLNIGADTTNPTAIAWNASGADTLAQFRDFVLKKRAETRAGFERDPRTLARAAVAGGIRDASGRRPEDSDGEE